MRPALARTMMLGGGLTLAVASGVHGGGVRGRLRVAGGPRCAPAVRGGWLGARHAHPQARPAEAVIATVLVLAALETWRRPAHARTAAIAGQGFALLGTLVGLGTIVAGIGPRTVPDVVYHVLLLAGLAAGLVWTVRCRPD